MTKDKDTWILYKTENLVNHRSYVGVHKLADNLRSKNYLGSGNNIKTAIKKYGRENFIRTTLAEFACAEDAYSAEEKMVTEEFIKRKDTYNISLGGRGSSKHTEEAKAKIAISHKGREFTEQHRAKISASAKGRKMTEETKMKIAIANTGKKHTEETMKKLRGRIVSEETRAKSAEIFRGKTHTEEAKSRMSEAAKLRTGAKNHSSIAVVINGKYYENAHIASPLEQTHYQTIVSRLKSPTAKWSEWRYATEEEKLSHQM
jgi:group I intron endonuclease